MIEVLELQDGEGESRNFKTWCKPPWQRHGRTRTSSERRFEKRAASAPARRSKEKKEITMEDRKINPEETPRPWRDLGDANMDENFLFPETANSKCPVNKHARKLSKDEANEYMKWIQLRIPKIDKKDERVYCPYCDMKNHPRWSCHHFHKHQKQNEKHSCTLCIGDHPAFLCPLAPGQRRHCDTQLRERKMAREERRAPDLRWYPHGVQPLPPPANEPQAQPMDASRSSHSARCSTRSDSTFKALCSSSSYPWTTSN